MKPIERPSGAELARRAIDDSKKEQDQTRSALGVQAAAKPGVPFKVLNAPVIPEPDKQLTETRGRSRRRTKPRKEVEAKAKAPATTTGAIAAKPSAPADKAPMRVASAAGAAKQMVEPPAAGQKCRVWTASYGGQKAMIIRSLVDKVVNYTVLDVNEGAEIPRSGSVHRRLRQGRQDHRRIHQPVASPRQGLRALPRRLIRRSTDDKSEPLRRGSSAACHLSAERTGPLRA